METALDASATQAATQSVSIDGMSIQSGVGININYIRSELTRCEKSLQRLYRGGRGMPVDMSEAGAIGRSGSTDPYRSGSEVLL